jgi:hypothetical protein
MGIKVVWIRRQLRREVFWQELEAGKGPTPRPFAIGVQSVPVGWDVTTEVRRD